MTPTPLTLGLRIKFAIKSKNLTQGQAADMMGISRQTLSNYLSKPDDEIDQVFLENLKDKLDLDFTIVNVTTKTTGEDLRKQKAFGDTKEDGLIYVPIAAQAGYAKHFTSQIFISDLERLYIPGLPYKGDEYRYFEVEGDSMEPTIKAGMQVIGQRIPPEYWKDLQDYYIHVIVTNSQVMIKRLMRLNDGKRLVAISDNEEMYPQFDIQISTIKELWVVKRLLDWRMPPPKKFEITIK